MAYREVTMLEVKEVLRLWLEGIPKKRIALQLGLDVKTVRRYVGAAWAAGLRREAGPEGLDEGLLATVVGTVQPGTGRPHGDGWAECTVHRAVVEAHLRAGRRLSKIRKLLRRQGVAVSYATLRRFAMAELGFGRAAPTIPVADCGPGEEVQLDTGWMIPLAPDATGRRRRFKAWIFTAVLSRHRFVYPVFRETTETAIEACEAAWAFFQGLFRVLIPDNTKAIVQRADPLEPLLNPTLPRVRPGARLRDRSHARAPGAGQGPRGAGRAQRARGLLRRRGPGGSRGRPGARPTVVPGGLRAPPP
jgi:transposase